MVLFKMTIKHVYKLDDDDDYNYNVIYIITIKNRAKEDRKRPQGRVSYRLQDLRVIFVIVWKISFSCLFTNFCFIYSSYSYFLTSDIKKSFNLRHPQGKSD